MLHRFPKPHIYEAETESVDFGRWREPEEEEARRNLAAQATGAAVQARMGRDLAAQATGEEDADVRRPKWRLGFPIQFCVSRGIPPGKVGGRLTRHKTLPAGLTEWARIF